MSRQTLPGYSLETADNMAAQFIGGRRSVAASTRLFRHNSTFIGGNRPEPEVDLTASTS